MTCKRVSVQHPPIEPGNDEAIGEFERCLASGLKEWAKRNKLTTEAVSQQLCETLLDRLQRRAASLITVEAITKIHSESSAAERRKLVKDICDRLSDSLRLDLILMSGLPRRGRRREYASRDRQIYRMHRSGLSYGAIAIKLKGTGVWTRHAVQAAYRRETKRRESVCRSYPSLVEFLNSIGIVV